MVIAVRQGLHHLRKVTTSTLHVPIWSLAHEGKIHFTRTRHLKDAKTGVWVDQSDSQGIDGSPSTLVVYYVTSAGRPHSIALGVEAA